MSNSPWTDFQYIPASYYDGMSTLMFLLTPTVAEHTWAEQDWPQRQDTSHQDFNDLKPCEATREAKLARKLEQPR